MTTFITPWDDDPLMLPAFLGCLSWAASTPEIVAQFEAETDLKLSTKPRSPLERMIDQATGYDHTKEVGQAFIEWLADTYFGRPDDLNSPAEIEAPNRVVQRLKRFP